MRFYNRIFKALIVLFYAISMVGCSNTYVPRAVTSSDKENHTILNVSPLSQFPLYPTGCESVTATMALNHAGINIDVSEFIDCHLPCADFGFYESDGLCYGPDPYTVFVGNPRTKNSYGCMAPVIEQALVSCVKNRKTIRNTTGTTLPNLCQNYIDSGIPVILWATMEMRPVSSGNMWFLEDGRQFIWPAGEHCLLLIGYSDTEYFFNDPRHGQTVAYDRNSTEVAYASLGKQSIVIL